MLFSRMKWILMFLILVLIYICSEAYLGMLLLGFFMLSLFGSIAVSLCVRNKLFFQMETTGVIAKKTAVCVIINIQNTSVFPAVKGKLTVEIRNRISGDQKREVLFFSVFGKQTESLKMEMKSRYCGMVEIEIQKAEIYDFYGIVRMILPIECQESIQVLPDRMEMTIECSEGRYESSGGMELYGDRKRDMMGDIDGYRNYLPGDSLQKIHWKLTEKWQDMIVKEYGITVERKILILLDTGKKTDTKPKFYDSMLEAVISLAGALLEYGYIFRVQWFNYKRGEWIAQEISAGQQLNDCVYSLLYTGPESDETDLLERFLSGEQKEDFSHILYFSTNTIRQENLQYMRELEITALLCLEPEQTEPADNIISYTPENWKSILRQFTI